jgi:hypothetical protein
MLNWHSDDQHQEPIGTWRCLAVDAVFPGSVMSNAFASYRSIPLPSSNRTTRDPVESNKFRLGALIYQSEVAIL